MNSFLSVMMVACMNSSVPEVPQDILYVLDKAKAAESKPCPVAGTKCKCPCQDGGSCSCAAKPVVVKPVPVIRHRMLVTPPSYVIPSTSNFYGHNYPMQMNAGCFGGG